MRAIWKDTVIAESDDTVVVEGNHYFPMEALKPEHRQPSDHTTGCFWKGTAHYLHIQVGDAINRDAAWYYPEPKSGAAQIKGRVAFWKGVTVVA